MSRRQPQPSLRCVVRVAPENCPEFQALCDALRRNDPTVTTVTTDRSPTPAEYGRRLGEALLSNNNSVVSEIDLNLSYLLLESDRRGRTTAGATPLLTWMEQSSSLRTVTLRTDGDGHDLEGVSPRLKQRLVDATKMNPNIRAFHSYMPHSHFPMQLLTDCVSTPCSRSKLQSLRIEIPNSWERDWEQAAQTIEAISGLNELSLACSIEFLEYLPARSTRLLLELDVSFTRGSSNVALLSSILASSKDLHRVAIKWLTIIRDTWDLVRSGLQSNPSITHLKLNTSSIAPEARPLIVNHMQSGGTASHQNLRYLDLSESETECLSTTRVPFHSPLNLAEMLYGSLLQHVTFDFRYMPNRGAVNFFEALSANSSTVRLRSMHLKGQFLWDMTAYLSSTIHLRHFTFTYLRRGELSLPSTFLPSLRRNGSLHTVELRNEEGQSYIPSDDVARMIQACMTRNRELPNMMTKAFHDEANAEGIESDNNCCHDAESATHKKSFPTLCQVSQQTERIAPNAMLRGLLASSDMLNTMSNSSPILGKRVAAAALEGV